MATKKKVVEKVFKGTPKPGIYRIEVRVLPDGTTELCKHSDAIIGTQLVRGLSGKQEDKAREHFTWLLSNDRD